MFKFFKRNKFQIVSILIILVLSALLLIYFHPVFKSFYNTLKFNFNSLVKKDFVYTKKEYYFNDKIVFNYDNFDGFKDRFNIYIDNIFNKNYFKSYIEFILLELLELLLNIFNLILLIIPFIILIKVYINLHITKENNDYDKDSMYFKNFKKYIYHPYLKVKNKIIDYINWLENHKYNIYILITILIFIFNGFSLVIDLIRGYFFLFSVPDVSVWFNWFYNIIMDVSPFICYFNYKLIFLLILLFLLVRYKIALKRRKNGERKNVEYLEKQSIVDFYTGSMGTFKTATITDMTLSYNVIFKNKALELLSNNMNKFKDFSFINFENDLKEKIKNHQIYNLATIDDYIKNKRLIFESNQIKDNCYNYDFERYGLYYNDRLNIYYLWDMLLNYAKEYFIYVMSSSMLISNYSIREDLIKKDKGNFILIDDDLFNRKLKDRKENSRYSHILDYDMLRIGRKIIKDNINENIYEFGILSLTEIGKERGNKFDLAGQKKNDEITNQTNDLFNHWLKLCRHTATIENYPFCKVLMDDQRAMSLGADVRDLAEVIKINKSIKNKCYMPFYFEKGLFHWMNKKLNELMIDYRYYRGDNTMFYFLIKNINALIYRHILNVENEFNYHLIVFNKYDISDNIDIKENFKYHLSFKKIFASRYATDCYNDYFKPLKLKSSIGLNDLSSYEKVYATTDEFHKQNSYFINELERLGKNDFIPVDKDNKKKKE